jgi:hypothetical protein
LRLVHRSVAAPARSPARALWRGFCCNATLTISRSPKPAVIQTREVYCCDFPAINRCPASFDACRYSPSRGPEVVDGAWRYFLVNWLVIGAMGATLAVGLMFTGFFIELSGFAISVGYVGIYGGFAHANACSALRRDPQVMFVLGGIAQLVLITAIMAPLTYVVASTDLPMQDANLFAIDRALGFNWAAYVDFVDDHPTLAAFLNARSNYQRRREGQKPSRLAYRAFLSAVLALDQPDNDQQDHRADEGIDDRGDEAAADGNAKPGQKPARNQTADDADNNVADQAEAAAFDDHAGEPARNAADDQPDDEALCFHVFPLIGVPARAK